jgi:head-tail adaptor
VLNNLMTTTAVRQRATATTDAYGNAVLDWTSPAEVVYPCRVYRPSSSENLDRGDRVTVNLRAVLPASADVTTADRLAVDGTTYQIAGLVNRVHSFARIHHLEADLVTIAGG